MYGRKGQSIQLGGYCTAVLVETVYRCTGTGIGVSVYRCIGVGVSVYLVWRVYSSADPKCETCERRFTVARLELGCS